MRDLEKYKKCLKKKYCELKKKTEKLDFDSNVKFYESNFDNITFNNISMGSNLTQLDIEMNMEDLSSNLLKTVETIEGNTYNLLDTQIFINSLEKHMNENYNIHAELFGKKNKENLLPISLLFENLVMHFFIKSVNINNNILTIKLVQSNEKVRELNIREKNMEYILDNNYTYIKHDNQVIINEIIENENNLNSLKNGSFIIYTINNVH